LISKMLSLLDSTTYPFFFFSLSSVFHLDPLFPPPPMLLYQALTNKSTLSELLLKKTRETTDIELHGLSILDIETNTKDTAKWPPLRQILYLAQLTTSTPTL
jgi:hypothetical protein